MNKFKHRIRNLSKAAAITLIFNACVGGNLSSKQEFEEYPLREATKNEGDHLKECLRASHQAQEIRRKKTGSYYKRAADLPVDAACSGFKLSQQKTETGHEILAQFNEDDSTVRWSINQDGVIEEHLGGEEEDLDLELEL